jgi:RNA-directed DNA polymerase
MHLNKACDYRSYKAYFSLFDVNDGFEFLGFNIRKYKEKLLTKPSKASVKSFLLDIKKVIKANIGAKCENLIHLLNPKIRGWTNYFRSSAASKTFSYINHRIFKMLYRWAIKRHNNKSAKWIYQKYFYHAKLRKWTFHAKTISQNNNVLSLILADSIKIRRHTKIIGNAHPYDPSFKKYFQKRDKRYVHIAGLQNKALLVA